MILDDSQILIYLFLDKLQYISTILLCDLFMLNNDSDLLLYVFFSVGLFLSESNNQLLYYFC